MRHVILAIATLFLLLGTTSASAQWVPLNPSQNPQFNPAINPQFNPSINPNLNPSINPNFNPSINPRYNPNAPVGPVYNPQGKSTGTYGVPNGQGGTNYFDGNGQWNGYSPRP